MPADQTVVAEQSESMPARSPTVPTYALLSVFEDMPDSVADPIFADPIFADPKAVAATQMRIEFVAQAPGASELGLYSIPPGGSDYVVSARAPMMVTPSASK